MANLVAIDLGYSAIKIISAEKKKNQFTNIQTFKMNYNSSLLHQKKITKSDSINFYEINQDRLVETLLEVKQLLPQNSKFFLSINSINADIYFKKVSAKNLKRLKIAAGFFIDVVKKQDFTTEYNIIKFDKKKKEGEFFVYSYKPNLLNDYLSIIEDAGISPHVIEFDAVALINAFEQSLSEDDYKLLINIGLSKTIFILFKNKQLEKFTVTDFGVNVIYNKISQTVGTPIMNVQSNFIKDDNFEEYCNLKYDSIFKNLILNLKTEIEKMNFTTLPTIVLDGGFAQNIYFNSIFSRFFDNFKIEIFNPFNDYFDDFKTKFPKSEFSIATGLLMR